VEQRAEPLRGGVGVVRLHAEEDVVGRADLRRVVRRGDASLEVAGDAAYAEAAGAERLEVRTAGDQRHVGAAGGEPAAEVPADPAGSEDGDAHYGPRASNTVSLASEA